MCSRRATACLFLYVMSVIICDMMNLPVVAFHIISDYFIEHARSRPSTINRPVDAFSATLCWGRKSSRYNVFLWENPDFHKKICKAGRELKFLIYVLCGELHTSKKFQTDRWSLNGPSELTKAPVFCRGNKRALPVKCVACCISYEGGRFAALPNLRCYRQRAVLFGFPFRSNEFPKMNDYFHPS